MKLSPCNIGGFSQCFVVPTTEHVGALVTNQHGNRRKCAMYGLEIGQAATVEQGQGRVVSLRLDDLCECECLFEFIFAHGGISYPFMYMLIKKYSFNKSLSSHCLPKIDSYRIPSLYAASYNKAIAIFKFCYQCSSFALLTVMGNYLHNPYALTYVVNFNFGGYAKVCDSMPTRVSVTWCFNQLSPNANCYLLVVWLAFF